jgi:hypothetical protein
MVARPPVKFPPRDHENLSYDIVDISVKSTCDIATDAIYVHPIRGLEFARELGPSASAVLRRLVPVRLHLSRNVRHGTLRYLGAECGKRSDAPDP